MRSSRHPHPHIDPRAPRDNTRPGTNPPVFAWMPVNIATDYSLTVAGDPALENIVLEENGFADPLVLPEKAFEPGTYYWKWQADNVHGEVFCFEITADAVVLEVPLPGEWLKRFGDSHPRFHIKPDDLSALRASRENSRSEIWKTLKASADILLNETHNLAEPPFLFACQVGEGQGLRLADELAGFPHDVEPDVEIFFIVTVPVR